MSCAYHESLSDSWPLLSAAPNLHLPGMFCPTWITPSSGSGPWSEGRASMKPCPRAPVWVGHCSLGSMSLLKPVLTCSEDLMGAGPVQHTVNGAETRGAQDFHPY